jgi:hypothetical protein
MTLADLAAEYLALRGSSGILLDDFETLDCFVRAARAYAAWGGIQSVDLSGAALQSAPGAGGVIPAAPDLFPDSPGALPVRGLGLLSGETVVTVGEWSVIQPLAVLYVERENGMRLEAARANGIEFFGRDVASVAGDIAAYEASLPERSFVHPILTIA